MNSAQIKRIKASIKATELFGCTPVRITKEEMAAYADFCVDYISDNKRLDPMRVMGMFDIFDPTYLL